VKQNLEKARQMKLQTQAVNVMNADLTKTEKQNWRQL